MNTFLNYNIKLDWLDIHKFQGCEKLLKNNRLLVSTPNLHRCHEAYYRGWTYVDQISCRSNNVIQCCVQLGHFVVVYQLCFYVSLYIISCKTH